MKNIKIIFQFLLKEDAKNIINFNNKSKLAMICFINMEGVTHFINLWPLEQWIYSLIALGVFYIGLIQLFRKFTANKRFKEIFTVQACCGLYLLDIFLNIGFDIIILYGTKTSVLFKMVEACPISFSPVIIIVEGIFFYYYCKSQRK